MNAVIYGGTAGLVASSLIVAIGVTATAWVVLALSVAAIIFGAVEYVRSH